MEDPLSIKKDLVVELSGKKIIEPIGAEEVHHSPVSSEKRIEGAISMSTEPNPITSIREIRASSSIRQNSKSPTAYITILKCCNYSPDLTFPNSTPNLFDSLDVNKEDSNNNCPNDLNAFNQVMEPPLNSQEEKSKNYKNYTYALTRDKSVVSFRIINLKQKEDSIQKDKLVATKVKWTESIKKVYESMKENTSDRRLRSFYKM